jgi:hypothetical protein
MNAILIDKDFSKNAPALFHTLGFPKAEFAETISFDDATALSASGKAIGFRDGWTVLLDAFLFLDQQELSLPEQNALWPPAVENGLLRVSTEARTFGFMIAGTSSTFGFECHLEGEKIRCRLIQGSRLVFDHGKPLPHELDIFAAQPNEEYRVLRLLSKLTLPARSLAEITYDSYEFVGTPSD